MLYIKCKEKQIYNKVIELEKIKKYLKKINKVIQYKHKNADVV